MYLNQFNLTKGYKKYRTDLQHTQVPQYESLQLFCATKFPRMLIYCRGLFDLKLRKVL